MNERIEKLWTKVCQCEMPELDETCMTSQRRTKFAELIVRECADIAKGEPASFYDRDAYKLGRKFASEDVLKHFGVEE